MRHSGVPNTGSLKEYPAPPTAGSGGLSRTVRSVAAAYVVGAVDCAAAEVGETTANTASPTAHAHFVMDRSPPRRTDRRATAPELQGYGCAGLTGEFTL